MIANGGKRRLPRKPGAQHPGGAKDKLAPGKRTRTESAKRGLADRGGSPVGKSSPGRSSGARDEGPGALAWADLERDGEEGAVFGEPANAREDDGLGGGPAGFYDDELGGDPPPDDLSDELEDIDGLRPLVFDEAESEAEQEEERDEEARERKDEESSGEGEGGGTSSAPDGDGGDGEDEADDASPAAGSEGGAGGEEDEEEGEKEEKGASDKEEEGEEGEDGEGDEGGAPAGGGGPSREGGGPGGAPSREAERPDADVAAEAPQPGIDADVSLDLEPPGDRQDEAIRQNTGLSFLEHVVRSQAHLKEVRERAEDIQEEIIDLAETLAADLTGLLSVHAGNISGGKKSAETSIEEGYEEGRDKVGAARQAAFAEVEESKDRAHVELTTTHARDLAALVAAVATARAELQKVRSEWTEPFEELEEDYAEDFEAAADQAATNLDESRPLIRYEWLPPLDDDVEAAKKDKMQRHAMALTDEAVEETRAEGPAMASREIESLGHAEILAIFIEPLERRVNALGDEGFATLESAVAKGRDTIDSGAADAEKEIDTDSRRAARQLHEDEGRAKDDIAEAAEQLELDVEAQIDSANARFTETSAAQAKAYDARVKAAIAGLEGSSFLSETQVEQFAASQIEELEGMRARHREGLEALDRKTRERLETEVLEGVEAIEKKGRDEADEAREVGSTKATALREIAARYAQSLTDVSAGVSRQMEAYVNPFGPRTQEWIDEVQEKLDEREEESEEKLEKSLADYEEQLDEKMGVDAFVDEIDPEPPAEGTEGQLRDIVNGAYSALDKWRTSKSGLFGALRQIESFWMGQGVYEMWDRQQVHSDTLKEMIDGVWRSSVRKIAFTYLRGDREEAARLELEDCTGFLRNDEDRIEEVLRSLDDDERENMRALPDWDDTADDLRSSLSGTDLDVTEALLVGNEARADAYRMIEGIDEARREGDVDALHDELEGMHDERRGEIAQEAAYILEGGSARASVVEHVEEEEAFDALSDYATRELDEDEQMEAFAQAYGSNRMGAGLIAEQRAEALAGTDKDLADALIRHGSIHEETDAARMEHERTREGGPDQERLERMLKAPEPIREAARLTGDDEALQEFQAARMAAGEEAWKRRYGGEGKPEDWNGAIEDMHAGSENAHLKIRLNKELLNSGTNSPEAVAVATALMIEDSGTDEEMVERYWEGLTPAETETATEIFEREYGEGDSLDDALFGGIFSELSGDDELDQRRRMLGDERYMNDEELRELAELEQEWSIGAGDHPFLETEEVLAQGDRLGFGDAHLNVLQHTSDLDALIEEVEEENGGRAFDDDGVFLGDEEQTARYRDLVQFVGNTAEQHRTQVDRAAARIVNTLKIAGAVAATVLTAGKASPLLVAAVVATAGGTAIATERSMRGRRYGWDEVAKDSGKVAVDALTAGAVARYAPGGSSVLRQTVTNVGTSFSSEGAKQIIEGASLVEVFQAAGDSAAKAGISSMVSGALGNISKAKQEAGSQVAQAARPSRQDVVLAGLKKAGTSAAGATAAEYAVEGDDANLVQTAVMSAGTSFLAGVGEARQKQWTFDGGGPELGDMLALGVGAATVQEIERFFFEDDDALAAATVAARQDPAVLSAAADLEAASQAGTTTLDAKDSEQAGVVGSLDERIRDNLIEEQDGEIQTTVPQDEAQRTLDGVEEEVLEEYRQKASEVFEHMEALGDAGDRVRDRKIGEVAAAVEAAAAEEPAGQERGPAPEPPSEDELIAEGARELGLDDEEVAIARELSVEQVEDWQRRVEAGEGTQGEVLRQIATGAGAEGTAV